MRGRRGIVAAVATATLATTSSQAHQAAEQRSFAAGSTGSAMPHGCHSSHPLQAVATAAAGVACRKEEERGVLPPIVEDTLIVAGSDVQKQQQERRMGSERTNNGDADSRSSSGSKCPLLPRCDRRTGTTTATAAAHTISSNSPSMARRIPRSCPQRTTASTVSRHGSRLAAWGRASLGENQRHRPKSCAATLSPLFARGGGVGGGRWFTGVVRRDDVYDEFPDDFDYESAANDGDDTMDDDIDDDVLSWMAEEKRKWGSDGVGNDLDERPPGAQEEVGDGGLKTKETERRGLRTEEAGVGSWQLDLPPASSPSPSPAAKSSTPPPSSARAEKSNGGSTKNSRKYENIYSQSAPTTAATEQKAQLRDVQGKRGNARKQRLQRLPTDLDSGGGSVVASGSRSLLGAVLGALVGVVGLRMWEGFHRRGFFSGGAGVEEGKTEDEVGEREEVEAEAEAAANEVQEQQERIQTLEKQLSYLEEDRRRVAAAAKEARASRRKEERQLKEYVHTLELHLDQLSKERQAAEAAVVESVKAETSKALERAQKGHQEALAAATAEIRRLHSDLDATKTLLEAALREKAAADALLRTEQGHVAALEKEVERLRESAAAQSQKLLDAVSEVERAKRGASSARSEAMAEGKAAALKEASVARKEDAARLRREMETALAEEKEELRKQMEARLATMRAGLKRRLREVRAERSGDSGGIVGSSSAAAPSTRRSTSSTGSRAGSRSDAEGGGA